MKKWKLPGYSLFVLLCLALNYAGSTLSNAHSWPLWLDSAGTMFCAYLFGPVCGAIVGLTTNLLFYIASGDPWYYCAVSVGIAVVVGLAGKKRSLDTFFGTLSVCAMTAFVTLLISLPINLLLGNGSTGNLWGDAVIGFMKEQGIPTIPSVFIGQLYVELLDKLVILIILFLVMKLSRGLRSLTRRNQTEETEAGNGAASALALLLAAGLCAGSMIPAGARAEQPETTEINYGDYVQTIYSSNNGLPCGEANDIVQTNDGILWIGTYAGLYRYNGREFRWMDQYDSVRNVNCMYVDEEGRLWIGTNDNGLTILINEEVVNVVDQSLGLPANSVRSIIRSSDG